MTNNFNLIKNYFDASDKIEGLRGGPYKRTEVGQFVPSPLLHLDAAVNHLMSLGEIGSSSKFLDAGCGDANYLVSYAYRLRAPRERTCREDSASRGETYSDR